MLFVAYDNRLVVNTSTSHDRKQKITRIEDEKIQFKLPVVYATMRPQADNFIII